MSELRSAVRWTAEPPRPACDCILFHRWDCSLTPIWTQTVQEMGDPTAVVEAHADVFVSLRKFFDINRGYVWLGQKGRPCCLGDGHDGRCRM